MYYYSSIFSRKLKNTQNKSLHIEYESESV
ncbi:MAG: hypothetical protein ACI93S_001782 [Ancylomarina sp.]